MSNKKRIAEINKLIVSVQDIHDNHHKKIINVLHAIKRDDVDNSELQIIIKNLSNFTEEYVKTVRELVSGIRQVSLKYFRRIITKLEH